MLAAASSLTVEDARANDCFVLRTACENGHLGVAQWLTAAFGLTAEDARGARALSSACVGGHPELARWLITAFDLEPHCAECTARGEPRRPF